MADTCNASSSYTCRVLQSDELDRWLEHTYRVFLESKGERAPDRRYFERHVHNDPASVDEVVRNVWVAVDAADRILGALRVFRRRIYLRGSPVQCVAAGGSGGVGARRGGALQSAHQHVAAVVCPIRLGVAAATIRSGAAAAVEGCPGSYAGGAARLAASGSAACLSRHLRCLLSSLGWLHSARFGQVLGALGARREWRHRLPRTPTHAQRLDRPRRPGVRHRAAAGGQLVSGARTGCLGARHAGCVHVPKGGARGGQWCRPGDLRANRHPRAARRLSRVASARARRRGRRGPNVPHHQRLASPTRHDSSRAARGVGHGHVLTEARRGVERVRGFELGQRAAPPPGDPWVRGRGARKESSVWIKGFGKHHVVFRRGTSGAQLGFWWGASGEHGGATDARGKRARGWPTDAADEGDSGWSGDARHAGQAADDAQLARTDPGDAAGAAVHRRGDGRAADEGVGGA
eukprot:ctg_4089.g546